MVSLVKSFFRHKLPLNRINKTFIVLISKKNNPQYVNDIRPISLCNVIYKIISKVVANRLITILNNIVRHIADNYIIAHEILRSYRKKK